MKVYKLIGGPKDGEEQHHPNAPHPQRLHYATQTHYHEYQFMLEEFLEGDDSVITYQHHKSERKDER
jgi:hypothetical protein